MELKPCAECGIRVTDVDIRQGDGASLGGKFYCRKCAKSLDIKSDYTVVSPLQQSHSLSDTQFFRRAGKLFDELESSASPRRRGRKKREVSRPRPRSMPRPNPAQAKKGQSGHGKNPYALWIGVMVAVIILLVLIIVAVAVAR